MQARVTLARAIYSNAKILILDDVLSALDVHTARWVVDNCFAGDLVEGRTLILVVRVWFNFEHRDPLRCAFKTHNVAMASSVAHWVISLGLDGRVANQSPIYEALKQDFVLLAEVKKDQEALEAEEEVVAVEGEKKADKPSGKLMTKEEIAVGHVGWPARECRNCLHPDFSHSANYLPPTSQGLSLKSRRLMVLDSGYRDYSVGKLVGDWSNMVLGLLGKAI